MECHANSGKTVPWCCNHDIHAMETHTFQDVSGPRQKEREVQKYDMEDGKSSFAEEHQSLPN